MEAAHRIRTAVSHVTRLREACAADAALGEAFLRVKRLQARRFAGSYRDLLASAVHGDAARFFLHELYGERDFAERDAQFARIAGGIEKFFPVAVAQTAVDLASLHALTEDLDFAMAAALVQSSATSGLDDAAAYAHAWRLVDRRGDRDTQLATVLAIGDEMARLTRMPALRLMLRMMRAPSAAAGMGSLQQFLERGFDTFSALTRRRGAVESFLGTIREREAGLITRMFDADLVACETELARLLGQAP